MGTGRGHGGEQLARAMVPALAVLVLLFLPFQSSAGEWLRGDLHCHSLYSDGDSPVGEIIARAESNGLDFLAITDHDSDMNGTPIHWFDPEYRSERMILLYGVEWTTGDGHANVWSSEPFPYDDVWHANLVRDADAAVDAAHAQGALFSINHPVRNEWEYPIVEGTDCVEIWNGPMRVNQNFKATREFWENILLTGRRVTGVGGSDTHNLNGLLAQFTDIGKPTTWVYAEERNGRAILDGIRAGHASISYSREAVRLELQADSDGDGRYDMIMGDNGSPDGARLHFRIGIAGGEGGPGEIIEVKESVVQHLNSNELRFTDILWLFWNMIAMDSEEIQLLTALKNGEICGAWLLSPGPKEILFKDKPEPQEPTYYRVELYGKPQFEGLNRLIYGRRIAVTNPIYFNY